MDTFFVSEMLFNDDSYTAAEVARQIRTDFGVRVTARDIVALHCRIGEQFGYEDDNLFDHIVAAMDEFLTSKGVVVD